MAITIKDSGGIARSLKTTEAAGEHATHHIVDRDPWPATVTAYNVTLTDADTQYYQALPANCKRVEFKCRTLVDIRFAFETGKVATPTAPWLTLRAGAAYDSGPVYLASTTVYFAADTAGPIVEILAWS